VKIAIPCFMIKHADLFTYKYLM